MEAEITPTVFDELERDAERRLASSIVQKSFRDLTQREEALLDKLDVHWEDNLFKGKTRLIVLMSRHLNVSRATLYRGVPPRGPRVRRGAWHKLTEEEKQIVTTTFLSCENVSSFVYKCSTDRRLPRRSAHTWFRIFWYVSKKSESYLKYQE